MKSATVPKRQLGSTGRNSADTWVMDNTSGDDVLVPVDSKQLSMLTVIEDADYFLQNEFVLRNGTIMEDTEDDPGVFLNRALAIKDNTCFNPAVIQLDDRPLTAAKQKQQYSVWVVHTTESSRSSRAQPKFKQVRMFAPGEDPNVIVFAVLKEEEKMMVIQYHAHWEQELFDSLSLQRSEAVLVPGVEPGCTKYLFCQLSLDHAQELVRQYGTRPHFWIMPPRWYQGNGVDDLPR